MGKILSFQKNKKIIIISLEYFLNKFLRKINLKLNSKNKFILLNNCLYLLYKCEIEFVIDKDLYSNILFQTDNILLDKNIELDNLLKSLDKYIFTYIDEKYILNNVVLFKGLNCLLYVKEKNENTSYN